MKTLAVLFLLATQAIGAFTEFYVQSTGSNLNAGSTTSDAAAFTYAGGTFVRSTGVFTVASGNPSSDGVAVGDWASIYTTAGATTATFVARVTARDTTTITVSLTAIAGATSTVSETANAATCKVGGAWAGPATTVGFPIGFAIGTMMNSSNHRPRVNFLAGTYNITAAMVANKAGPVTFQGYQSSPGDGINKGLQDTSSKATIDGGTGTYYNLLQVSSGAQNNTFADFIFTHNGDTGSAADGVFVSENENMFIRCVFHDLRRAGIRFNAVGHVVECEAYACNQSNTSNFAAFTLGATGCTAIRCIAHDNTGSNVDGFSIGGTNLIDCVSESNGRDGARDAADTNNSILNCDFYNNGAAGLTVGTGSGSLTVSIHNCNFVNNTTYGIDFKDTVTMGSMMNCGFGAGTQANDSGQYSTVHGIEIIGTVTYANDVTPWTDPANGDFRISLAAAKGTGRGTYTQTAASYTGTVGYPDIGSNQHLQSSSTSRGFFLFFP